MISQMNEYEVIKEADCRICGKHLKKDIIRHVQRHFTDCLPDDWENYIENAVIVIDEALKARHKDIDAKANEIALMLDMYPTQIKYGERYSFGTTGCLTELRGCDIDLAYRYLHPEFWSEMCIEDWDNAMGRLAYVIRTHATFLMGNVWLRINPEYVHILNYVQKKEEVKT